MFSVKNHKHGLNGQTLSQAVDRCNMILAECGTEESPWSYAVKFAPRLTQTRKDCCDDIMKELNDTVLFTRPQLFYKAKKPNHDSELNRLHDATKLSMRKLANVLDGIVKMRTASDEITV